MFAQDLSTGKILANRTIDFCEMNGYIQNNIFLHSLLSHLMNNLQFALKCPFQMVSEARWKWKLLRFYNVYNPPNTPQGVYVIKEHRMPNYVVPGFGMTKGDKYLNVQKVKSRLEKHIETIFESSYMTEIIDLPWEPNSSCKWVKSKLKKQQHKISEPADDDDLPLFIAKCLSLHVC